MCVCACVHVCVCVCVRVITTQNEQGGMGLMAGLAMYGQCSSAGVEAGAKRHHPSSVPGSAGRLAHVEPVWARPYRSLSGALPQCR